MQSTIYTLLFWLVCSFSASAQGYLSQWRDKKGDWYFGLNTSTSRYCGDLSERYNIAHLQLSWGVGGLIQYRFDEHFSMRADVSITHLRGDQQHTKNSANGLSFSSVNPSASVGVQVDFRGFDYNQYNIPYGWLSLGAVEINPTTLYKGQQVALSGLETEGATYGKWSGLVAYGVGLPFRVNKKTQIRLEGRYTHVLSDYLDDVSQVYADKSKASLLVQEVADRRRELGLPGNTAGAQRGNPSNNDGYFLLSLQVIYKR